MAGRGQPEEPTDADKTPVTIVTGFLGAGKTTLVNYILQGEHGKKIAVIENEFGEVNIDEALVSENLQYKEDVISMDNGCASTGWRCTLRAYYYRAYARLRAPLTLSSGAHAQLRVLHRARRPHQGAHDADEARQEVRPRAHRDHGAGGPRARGVCACHEEGGGASAFRRLLAPQAAAVRHGGR